MAFVNYNNKEITAKIVYYGPALSGKTTCLRFIYNCGEIENKGKLITLDTDGDRTLFFDFLPLEIGKLGNYSIKIQLYTVPGQVAYDTTRKLVLQGADGVVFVADSQVVIRDQNIESLSNLKKNLALNNIKFNEVPLIFLYNKRDLKEILPIDSLNTDLNKDNKAFFPTVAITGENVLEGLHAIIKLTIIHLKNKLSIFQKDKTVMFTREEITATAIKKEQKETTAKPTPKKTTTPPTQPEEAEEEIFELSSSMASAPEPEEVMELRDEEEIFQLDDAQEIKRKDKGIIVPDFQPEDENQRANVTPAAEQFYRQQFDVDEYITPVPGAQKYEVPISLNIPKSAHDIRVEIVLHLHIKKT